MGIIPTPVGRKGFIDRRPSRSAAYRRMPGACLKCTAMPMTGATTADENIRLIELYEASFSQVGRADFGGDGIIAWLARTCQSQSNWLDTFSHGWDDPKQR